MNQSVTQRAGGTINICRFVVPDTSNPNSVVQASAATVLPSGISTDYSKTRPDPDIAASPNVIAAVAGDPIKIFKNGAPSVSLYCNAAWNPGDLLMTDASGFGIVATTGNYYGARALDTGVVGALCPVEVVSGYKA